MLDTKTIAKALDEDRSKASVDRMVQRMYREGIDLVAYVKDIRDHPIARPWLFTWTLSNYIQGAPDIGDEAVAAIWSNLKICKEPSRLRDYWRALTFVEIPEDIASEVFDAAQKTMISAQYAVAVRVHSMLVAMNIARPYPELLDELDMIFEQIERENESAGLNARSRNLRKQIKKLKSLL